MKYLFLAFVLLISSFSAAAQDARSDAQDARSDAGVKLISAPEFVISAEDEAAGIDGKMQVATDINKSGDVTNAIVYVGPSWPCSSDFYNRVNKVMRDAEKAVRTYKFSPAIRSGKPVETRVGISLTIGKSARQKLEAKPSTARTDPNGPKSINAGVVNGKALSLPKPAYPAEARSARASGTVKVQVLIGEDGKVISAQAVDGSPLLQFAARASACEAKFSPTTLQGNPVKVSGVIVYNFEP